MPSSHRAALPSAPVRPAPEALPARVVMIDVEALKAVLRDVLAEVLSAPAAPEFYSQACPPPGMSRRTFLDAVRRGDFPARAVGKLRLVAREDFLAFVANAPPVRVRVEAHPTPANDVRALVRASQGR